MLRQGAVTTCTAMEWRSKAQTSNGIAWKSEARAMDARRSFDKRSKGKAIHRKATAKHGIDMISNGKKKRKETR